MNLNNIYNKELVTKELLYEHISDLDIYNMYMEGKPVHINKAMLSPLRDEKNTSFGFFIKNKEVLFNDFVLGGGDCIKFVQLKYELTYVEALAKIVNDFELNDYFITTNINLNKVERKIIQSKSELLESDSSFRLAKRSRKWKLHDIKYWKQFGITLNTLKQYNVEPIDYFFINDKIIKADNYAYSFTERKDGYETYKIYQPFNEKYKWLNNHNDSIWQGWNELPKSGNELIITKSLKDVMSINEILGISAISLQAESVKPKDKIINELKSRFYSIYIFYDNDFDKQENWGQKYATKLIEDYTLFNICIPDEYNSKDFSDLVKNYGIKESKSITLELIHNILPF